MTVGFDARLLAHDRRPTGVGLYARHLVGALVRLGVALTLYTDAPPPEVPAGARLRRVRPWARLPWQQTALVAALGRDRPTVYHSPSFTLPAWAPVPLVVTVHDLSFERYPAYVEPATRDYLRRMVPRALRAAARVITPSARVAEEIAAHYGLSPRDRAKLRPVPLGVDTERWRPGSPEAVAAARAAAGLDRPYLLFVGTREPRKNLGRLLEAYRRLRAGRGAEAPDLVLVGSPAPGAEALEAALAAAPGVRRLPYTAADTLVRLVEGAVGLVYVSEYEGFGLPVLEALAVGTPVLTARESPMADLAGAFAHLADPLDVADIARGLEALVDGRAAWAERAAAARAWAAAWTWERTARATLAVYEELDRP
ncbi:MAG: glycosyltransferase family 4 protein [Actinomycetia bacterium]|nr:glycosyltransferase family 4 protein [Actinomycetes bacterium]